MPISHILGRMNNVPTLVLDEGIHTFTLALYNMSILEPFDGHTITFGFGKQSECFLRIKAYSEGRTPCEFEIHTPYYDSQHRFPVNQNKVISEQLQELITDLQNEYEQLAPLRRGRNLAAFRQTLGNQRPSRGEPHASNILSLSEGPGAVVSEMLSGIHGAPSTQFSTLKQIASNSSGGARRAKTRRRRVA
jgi:hypothetical protein